MRFPCPIAIATFFSLVPIPPVGLNRRTETGPSKSRRSIVNRLCTCLSSLLLLTIPVAAIAAFDSGSSGSDGSFHPLSDVVIDLTQAGSGAGAGTYDPERWAVIFNYTDVTIPAGVMVQFKGHPSGAPVVWLVSGDVTIGGGVRLAGEMGGGSSSTGTPGPGGFAGGIGGAAYLSRGFGPGGAGRPTSWEGSGGSYGTAGTERPGSPVYPPYGNVQIMPLIGGSGGASSGGVGHFGGGGGGGAILIAASGTITVETGGYIYARGGFGASDAPGGSGAGSGGAIRLLATTFSGSGQLDATGGYAPNGGSGGDGRIRVEAENLNLGVISTPAWTYDLEPGPVFPDATAPVVFVKTIAGLAVTADPHSGFSTVDHTVSAPGAVELVIEAHYVPVGTTVGVYLAGAGQDTVVTSSPLAGTLALSTATATVNFAPLVNTEIYLKANW